MTIKLPTQAVLSAIRGERTKKNEKVQMRRMQRAFPPRADMVPPLYGTKMHQVRNGFFGLLQGPLNTDDHKNDKIHDLTKNEGGIEPHG